MKNTHTYEWGYRNLDSFGDAGNVAFEATLKHALANAKDSVTEDLPVWSVYLHWDCGNEDDGRIDDGEAELNLVDWTLPETFDNGRKVPKRFHNEVAKLNPHFPDVKFGGEVSKSVVEAAEIHKDRIEEVWVEEVDGRKQYWVATRPGWALDTDTHCWSCETAARAVQDIRGAFRCSPDCGRCFGNG